MKTLNIRIPSLRTIVMAVVAVVAVAASAPQANAVPIPLETHAILDDLEDRGEARDDRMRVNIQTIHARMESQVLAGVQEGRPYAQLVKIVEKASIKAEKEARSMAKDIHKMSNKARKSLLGAPLGEYLLDDTYELDAEVDAIADEIDEVLPEAWFEWLNTVLD